MITRDIVIEENVFYLPGGYMKSSFKLLVCLFLLIPLFISCSDEKKEEAAKMEQEMMGDSQAVADSAALVDSMGNGIAEDTTFEPEAIPEETETLKEMPKQPAGDGYTVQVAGCEDRAYAEYLVGKFTKRGYEPFVTTATVEGQTFYRVRIGVYESFSEAKVTQAELLDKYSLDTWIDVTSAGF